VLIVVVLLTNAGTVHLLKNVLIVLGMNVAAGKQLIKKLSVQNKTKKGTGLDVFNNKVQVI